MAEAHDALGVVGAPTKNDGDPDFFPLNDLPNDLLVSVFAVAAAEDPTWVRHTFPLVCKAWNELYCSKNASPLHETLVVDFAKEAARAADAQAAADAEAAAAESESEESGSKDEDEEDEYDDEDEDDDDSSSSSSSEEEEEWPPRRPVVHASRVISWAQAEGRAGSVRKLDIKGELYGAVNDFSSKDLGRLVAVVGPSMTDISVVGPHVGELCKRPFWESLRTSVAPSRRLRSLVVEGVTSVVNESDVEPIGQLAGSLEELVLKACNYLFAGLPRFPESLLALKKLRRLVLDGHQQITAIPAGISSLKKLKDVDLSCCRLSSLPKELVELSGLTRLDLGGNTNLGSLPEDEAFPAELKTMKSLRDLSLCGLRTVPAFVCELESLESLTLRGCRLSSLPKELCELSGLTSLDLSFNRNLRTTPESEAFPAELGKMKSLRDLSLHECHLRTVPAFVAELESLEVLDLSYNDLSLPPEDLGQLSGRALELAKMKSLRELDLCFCGLRTVPAFVGELQSLERLSLRYCRLSSLPKKLGELSKLTRLDLGRNYPLGDSPGDKAFPAELGNMKSLRELHLDDCSLRTIPAFLCELESLEELVLGNNEDLQFDASLDVLIEGCPRLREVILSKNYYGSWTPKSRAHLEAFKPKLLTKNPDAKVIY